MKKIIVFFIYLTMGINILFAQDIESNIKERLTDYFNKYTATAKISTPKLNSFDIDYDRKTIAVYASESFVFIKLFIKLCKISVLTTVFSRQRYKRSLYV